MESLVHKTTVVERISNTHTTSNPQYSSMSNANLPASPQATVATQIVAAQPSSIPKAAKPVHDSAQFVNDDNSILIVHNLFELFD